MQRVTVRYTEISFDDDHETHFFDREKELEAKDYAPPAPPVSAELMADCSRVLTISFPSGFGYDVFHPAPKHQWAIILSGQLELGVSDGEVRRFSSGRLLNIIDAGSKGHTTRVVGDEDVVLLVAEY